MTRTYIKPSEFFHKNHQTRDSSANPKTFLLVFKQTQKMDSNTSDTTESCIPEYQGELCYAGESCRTPIPSTPDTCVTSTLSCVDEGNTILLGDYEMSCCRELPELTLALIKPDGMKYLEEIERRIRSEGFQIVNSRRVHLSPEQASNFYYEHYGTPYFPLLVSSMSEGPIRVHVLSQKDAVTKWKFTCGPTDVDEAKRLWPDSLRAIYGTSGKEFKNVCHGSANEAKAREEIRFFFPTMVLDNNFLNETNVEDYIKDNVNPTLFNGLIELCKNKPLDPISWLGGWLLKHNPLKPKLPEDIALVPT